MDDARVERVEVRRRFAAPSERVFDAFVEPLVARHFLFATATGVMIEAEIDARVGGAFVFTERRPQVGDVRHVGEYALIDRPRRLRFAFGVPQFDPRFHVVDITIDRDGEGCELRLVNEDVPAALVERTREGWRRILDGLLHACDGVHAAGWR